MYTPPHFEETNQEEIASLIRQFPLATLVCYHDGELVANHIPLLQDQDGRFIGHVAKANPLHQFFPEGADALAIFQAEDAYISPNWYPTKKDTHRHVPTWNYQVVHVHGTLRFQHSKKAKLGVLAKLTQRHERQQFREKAWKMADAPKDYLEQMLDNIVALELSVQRITAKSKLSQNREPIDYNSVVDAMNETGKDYLASAMARLKKTEQ